LAAGVFPAATLDWLDVVLGTQAGAAARRSIAAVIRPLAGPNLCQL
jgi:hypothetical protein